MFFVAVMVAASSAAEAVDRLAEHSFDVLVSDTSAPMIRWAYMKRVLADALFGLYVAHLLYLLKRLAS